MAEHGTLPMKCTWRKPSGFSEPSHYETECIVVAFIFGKHRDAFGYNQSGETLLCVFLDEHGFIQHAPARQFVTTNALRQGRKEAGE